jgi:hypothetical protein
MSSRWNIDGPLPDVKSSNLKNYLIMSAETFVKLIEEMVELKVQQHLAATLKVNPELAKVVGLKREADRRRLEQVRAELVQSLTD